MNAVPALIFSLALVTGGYAAARHLETREALRALLDGFVLVMVAGLCLLFILPEAFRALGGWAPLLAGLGFLVPTLSERLLQRHEGEGPPVFLVAALLLLAAHGGLDGAVLARGGEAHEAGLELSPVAATLAILVHRLPVGLFLGSTVRSLAGARWALSALAVVTTATAVGFALSETLGDWAEGPGAGALNALLAGGLLHVVVGHGADAPTHGRLSTRSAAAGALVGLVALALVPLGLPPALRAGRDMAWHLYLESAPAVLIGFLGAGLLALVPQRRLAQLMTGRTAFGSAVRGVIFGLPIPICSCGVVPLYSGLMRRGVPAAAAVAFLIATPELGVDSILLSFPLLGWQLTVVRFLAAVTLALVAGTVVGLLVGPPQQEAEPEPEAARGAAGARVWQGARDALDELGPWILAGIMVAGLIYPLLEPSAASAVPAAAQVPLLTAVSAPIYLCASSATPVASVLLSRGIAAGAVVAFLLAGPATNLTTYGAVRGFHGPRVTWLLIAVILGTTIGLGLVINQLPLPVPTLVAGPEHPAQPAQQAAGALFALLLAGSLWRQGPRGFLERLGIAHTHAEHQHQDRREGHDHDHEHGDHEHGDHEHGDHEHGDQAPPPPPSKPCCSGPSACGGA
ncbi:MAG: permease [Planctomycetota bacterium]